MNNYEDWSQLVAKNLKGEADLIAAIEKDELDDAAATEAFIRSVLDPFLPENYAVGSGRVVDALGNYSDHLDIVIYNRDFPRIGLRGTHSVYIYESVLATVIVKAKLIRKTFFDALNTSASLAALDANIDKAVLRKLAGKNGMEMGFNNEYIHSDPMRTARFKMIGRPPAFVYAFSGIKNSYLQLEDNINLWMENRRKESVETEMMSLPAVIATQGSFAWRNAAPLALSNRQMLGIGNDSAPVRLIVLQLLHIINRRINVAIDAYGLKPSLKTYLRQFSPPKFEAGVGEIANELDFKKEEKPKKKEKPASVKAVGQVLADVVEKQGKAPEAKPMEAIDHGPVKAIDHAPVNINDTLIVKALNSAPIEADPEPVEEPKPASVEAAKPKPVEMPKSVSVEAAKPKPVEMSKSASIEAAKPKPVEMPKPASIEAAKPKPVEMPKPASIEAAKPKPVEVTKPVSIEAAKPAPSEVKLEPVEAAKPVPSEVKPKPIEVAKQAPAEVSKPEPVEAFDKAPVIETRPSAPAAVPDKPAPAGGVVPDRPPLDISLAAVEDVEAYELDTVEDDPIDDPEPFEETVQFPADSAPAESSPAEQVKQAAATVAPPKPPLDISLLSTDEETSPDAPVKSSTDAFIARVKEQMTASDPFPQFQPENEQEADPFSSTIPQ